MKTQVYCTVIIEGLHCWPHCPFEEVSYLRNLHRHQFYIKAYKTVSHDDRDIEFIILKHRITSYLRYYYFDQTHNVCNFGSMSCEMIGAELIEQFDLDYVDVSEDNECGAIIHNNDTQTKRV